MQQELFSNSSSSATPSKAPLAFLARPTSLDQFVGYKELINKYPFLERKDFPSIILYGPPGSGKTSLAHLLATSSAKKLYPFSAVVGGVKELKEIIDNITFIRKEAIIFIDEIHRFNKAQQDLLLPYVEARTFTLIGATTENPRSSIIKPLLSRLQLVELKKLGPNQISWVLENINQRFQLGVGKELLELVTHYSIGDVRRAINNLELIAKEEDFQRAEELIRENSRYFDKDGDRHYDLISAFIKSLRGSDPNAALLYLAIMLDGGEDPAFIARRMVIFASEDIGNADINALPLAVAAMHAAQNIGMPEARINLAQAATYLASTVKSNASYLAIDAALKYVKEHPCIDTPDHLKNYPPPGTTPYKYPHDYPEHFVNQEYTREKIPTFYHPTKMGHELRIKERLERLRRN